MDLAARRAVNEIAGDGDVDLEPFSNPETDKYAGMVDRVRKSLNLNTLGYQRLGDLVDAIGLPKEKLCTYCWDGCDGRRKCGRSAGV